MKSNIEAALAFVFKDEGGYAERNTEGGGAVNRGVTFTVFSAWRLAKKSPASFADLKAMSQAEAADIYQAQYIKAISFEDLPKGIDYCVLDAAINGGVTGSLKLLQKALNLKPVDGHLGVVTKWAANHRPVPALIDALCDVRIAHYKTLKRFAAPYQVGKTKTWGDIWTARINMVRSRAKAMAGL
jgi:lysozyme family protein